MPEAFVSPEDVIRHSARADGVTPEKKGNHAGLPKAKRSNVYKMFVWQRRAKMAAMCADGMTLTAIAEEHGVSMAYVSQEIGAVVEELKRQALDTMQLKISREVAVLNMVQLEATIAWFESKEGKVTNVKRRKREIRSSMVRGGVRNGAAIGFVKDAPLGQTERKTRSRFAALFEDGPAPTVEEMEAHPSPDPNIPLDRQQTQNLVQLPIDSEEEYSRTEESSGAPEFLRIILDCHEKRSRLLGLYKGQEEDGYEAIATLTPEQRVSRLTALAQDIRAAKAIVDAEAGRGSQLPPQTSAPIPANGWAAPDFEDEPSENGEAHD